MHTLITTFSTLVALCQAAITFCQAAEDSTKQGWLAMPSADPAKVAEALAGPAEEGEAEAIAGLAFLHDIGVGVDMDGNRAIELLQKASASGLRFATEYLAWKYEIGFGIEADPAKATQLREVAATQDRQPIPIPDRWLKTTDDGGFAPSFRRAALWMLDEGEAGNPIAMANLARAFLGGPWVGGDASSHVYWLRKAAEAGHAESNEQLALYYEAGVFVVRDEKQAEVYRRRAAEAGRPESQHAMGKLEAVRAKDDPIAAARAIAWYEKAAAQGNAESMTALAHLYLEGEIIPQDDTAALEWFRKAAENDNLNALENLGWMYENARGVIKSPRKAAEYYRQAVALGSGWAGVQLGDLLGGTDLGEPDLPAAREQYRLAAERGNVDAMIRLSMIYFQGRGVDQNWEESFLWTEMAAREGNAWAQNRIGWMLQNGYGIEQDDEEAVTWFKLGAEKGNATAMGNLGLHYANGRGVEPDIAQAISWLTRSIRTERSGFFLNELGQILANISPEDAAVAAAVLRESAYAGKEDPNDPLAGFLCDTLLNGPRSLRDEDEGKRLLEKGVAAEADWAIRLKAIRLAAGLDGDIDLEGARALLLKHPGSYPYVENSEILLRIEACMSEDMRAAALRRLRTQAEEGSVAAAVVLARAYSAGDIVVPDAAEARRFISLAKKSAADSNLGTYERMIKRVESAVARLEAPALERPEGDAANEPDSDSSLPVPIHRVAPVFPPDLKRLGIEGWAKVRFTVGETGTATGIEVDSASHPFFGLSAAVAVAQWRFHPGRLDGQPIAIRMLLPFRFNLSDEPVHTNATP